MSKSFNNTKNKIKTIWNLSQKNKNQVDNELKRINIQLKDINFAKNLLSINLAEDVLIDDNISTFEYTLQNFPDWAIPMAHIVPIFNFDDSYPIADVTIISDYSYAWTKIENTHYTLTIYLSVIAVHNFIQIPVYLNMNIVIINEKNYYNIKTEGI